MTDTCTEYIGYLVLTYSKIDIRYIWSLHEFESSLCYLEDLVKEIQIYNDKISGVKFEIVLYDRNTQKEVKTEFSSIKNIHFDKIKWETANYRMLEDILGPSRDPHDKRYLEFGKPLPVTHNFINGYFEYYFRRDFALEQLRRGRDDPNASEEDKYVYKNGLKYIIKGIHGKTVN